MKTFGIVAVALSFVIAVCFIAVYRDEAEVLFESEESKSANGGPIFNKIKWFRQDEKDIWMMNQSHHGSEAFNPKWDRLAIVVDTKSTPKTARFYQLESGELRWSDNLPETPFKVSCFMCHANGPRVIRPNFVSPLKPLSLFSRAKVFTWNLRIKSYGRVVFTKEQVRANSPHIVPVRYESNYENRLLKVKTCTRCHSEEGLWAREPLRGQQIPTIKFMLEAGYMPPRGFSVPPVEAVELEKFLRGF